LHDLHGHYLTGSWEVRPPRDHQARQTTRSGLRPAKCAPVQHRQSLRWMGVHHPSRHTAPCLRPRSARCGSAADGS